MTFYKDCHCEIDGEDSVHYSKRYAFDERRRIIWIHEFLELHAGKDGVLAEMGVRNYSFWEKLEGQGVDAY